MSSRKKLNVFLCSLYSDRYPAIGESHGLSVIAGTIHSRFKNSISEFQVMDMVLSGKIPLVEVANKILQQKPNIIGISVNYGTYSELTKLINFIKSTFEESECLIMFGGALPTYIPKQVLDLFPKGVVVVGEGDEVVPLIIERWQNHLNFELLPNTAFLINDKLVVNHRKLVNPEKISLPYRKHLSKKSDSKSQIYIETSRGCSWAACTFCLRGLTDVKGTRREYRTFSLQRTTADIQNLYNSGFKSFTFADEDFLGGDLFKKEQLVDGLLDFFRENEIKLSFDVSMTVNSVYYEGQKEGEKARINLILSKLKKIGLRKVFLGIESGSESQLKRYAKGHNKKEILECINILNDQSIQIELGFIMFDPLCSIAEIQENLTFLKDNNLARFVSFIGNELRLQKDSKFVKLLDVFENRNNCSVYNKELNLDTISYNYHYVDKSVDELLRKIKQWNKILSKIHYPLKNITRYGDKGILNKYRPEVIKIVHKLRNDYLDLLLNATENLSENESSLNVILKNASISFIELSKSFDSEIVENKLIKKTLQNCMEFLTQK